MCLDKAMFPFRIRKEEGEFVGWKVFSERGLQLYTILQGKGGKPFPIQEWIHESCWRDGPPEWIFSQTGQSYRKGFHLYRRKKDAMMDCGGFKVRKVYFDNILACGTQTEYDVIVAEKIYIL